MQTNTTLNESTNKLVITAGGGLNLTTTELEGGAIELTNLDKIAEEDIAQIVEK